MPYLCWLEEVAVADVPMVGGKNASLGELMRALPEAGVRVPPGFATTSQAYRDFVNANRLEPKIRHQLDVLRRSPSALPRVGRSIRQLFLEASFSPEFSQAIAAAYRELSQRVRIDDVDVAVRSSATAEDLPEASFAGQQETFLNVRGEARLLEACRRCFASLFTDRAIAYRAEHGIDHLKVALSVGVQQMVRSDLAGAGVAFSIDTETGFPRVVIINAAWGLGETVVKGTVNPDEYMVFKPLLDTPQYQPVIEKVLGQKELTMVYARSGSRTTKSLATPRRRRETFVLSDAEVLQLARWVRAIERHYRRPMDIEWAKDGRNEQVYIVQARPETVQSRKEADALKTYTLKTRSRRLVQGLSIGEAIVAGPVCRIRRVEDIARFKPGAILVTETTDPDWVPIMRQARGIVTDHGGRTCHAAIVSRELGIPAIVGTTNATGVLHDGQDVTLSCAEGDQGYIYEGLLDFEATEVSAKDLPSTRTRVMMNIGSPAAAFRWWRLPCEGIGLARMEFIINNLIKIHPMALIHSERVTEREARRQIRELTRGYADKTAYFVDHLARGIARIAASQYPEPVIVRMSDFKTNEYANLIGGRPFEPKEPNPMLGFRGASRYYHERYQEGFALECRAIKRVRETIGLSNVIVMIPFCRTLEEADRVLEVLAANGLRRGEQGLEIYVMCEIPSNVLLAEGFAKRFDGFSIGSNDLTQLVLGIDRDSELLAALFDERNEAVKQMIRSVIKSAHACGSKVGICGQAPSDYPEFAAFLVREGIDSISLNPDSVIRVKRLVAKEEADMAEEQALAPHFEVD